MVTPCLPHRLRNCSEFWRKRKTHLRQVRKHARAHTIETPRIWCKLFLQSFALCDVLKTLSCEMSVAFELLFSFIVLSSQQCCRHEAHLIHLSECE